MILTILRIGFINMRRDRVVQALTFLLPIMFFSIFALVFGSQHNVLTTVTNVIVVDEDHSELSRRIVDGLAHEGALKVHTAKRRDGAAALDPDVPYDRASAIADVRSSTAPIALILPAGFGAHWRPWNAGPETPTIEVLADPSDPVAAQVLTGLLQEVAFKSSPDLLAAEGIEEFQRYSGPLTPAQQQSVAELRSRVRQPAESGRSASLGVPTHVVNVMSNAEHDKPMVSFYAAGIGVMFLLFSASGAGGTLLDEEESGRLGRLLGSRSGMTGVLAGKWLFVMMTGAMQLTVMFAWGAIVFHLPMSGHLPGFAVMTLVTAGAAAAFGLVLATLSRSRQQLSGISTILILAMSALGGSMFPRFLMSDGMQRIGRVTFNAWALDGYVKVFWRDAPVTALWPEVSVLVSTTVIFLVLARLFARRWEAL